MEIKKRANPDLLRFGELRRMMLLRYLGKKRQHLAQKVKLRDF